MVLNFGSELESILNEVAIRQGLTAEELVVKTLKDRFAPPPL